MSVRRVGQGITDWHSGLLVFRSEQRRGLNLPSLKRMCPGSDQCDESCITYLAYIQNLVVSVAQHHQETWLVVYPSLQSKALILYIHLPLQICHQPIGPPLSMPHQMASTARPLPQLIAGSGSTPRPRRHNCHSCQNVPTPAPIRGIPLDLLVSFMSLHTRGVVSVS